MLRKGNDEALNREMGWNVAFGADLGCSSNDLSEVHTLKGRSEEKGFM